MLIACGSDSNKVDTPILSPTNQSIEAGKAVVLNVTNSTEVDWDLPTEWAGFCTTNTRSVNCTAPLIEKEFTFTAKAKADQSKTASAKITVVFNDPTIQILAAGSATKVEQGNTLQFTAQTSFPSYHPSNTPVWAVNSECTGTIDEDGLFTATQTSETCTVTASISASGGKTITSTPWSVYVPPIIDVIPDSVTIEWDETQQFEVKAPAGVAIDDLVWAVNSECTGTIDGDGLFTAGNTSETCTVTAAFTVDGYEESASATVKVVVPSLIETVFVENGTFWMGCTPEQGLGAESSCVGGQRANEFPAHQVVLTKPFNIGKYPVTQAQWNTVMEIESEDNPSTDKGDDLPVTSVNRDDVLEFIEKLNSIEELAETGRIWRLPTEAEWEYAARGGNKEKFCTNIYDGPYTDNRGNSYIFDNYNFGCKYSGSDDEEEVAVTSASPVVGHGRKPNELGLYDMSGNVGEWVNDWYGAYSDVYDLSDINNLVTNPTGPATGDSGITRGGTETTGLKRVSARNGRNAAATTGTSSRRSYIGFRLTRNAD